MKAEGGKIDLTTRTRQFALAAIRLYSALPKATEAQVIGKQLLRAGTSVGAHYREAIRPRSTAEFVSKVDGGRQELEETMYWLELLRDSGQTKMDLAQLLDEADQLMAILTTCARNAKNRRTDV
ncbi:MAG: four helix bundle protein [candidate division NC10 bacterium]|nr:four helix bundle protein [candidate division NC10 bacterium]MDE2321344.1 four helix bundle protein [candidate division NC10 bacterium]